MPRPAGTRVVICLCGRRSSGRSGQRVICFSCGRRTTLGPASKKMRWTDPDADLAKEAEARYAKKTGEENKVWRAANRDKLRHSGWVSYLRRVHGITEVQYLGLVAKQRGRCAICQKEHPASNRLYVDHDHVTKQVRGLLCRHCNLLLGHAFDSVETILSAVAYLREHGQRPLPGSR